MYRLIQCITSRPYPSACPEVTSSVVRRQSDISDCQHCRVTCRWSGHCRTFGNFMAEFLTICFPVIAVVVVCKY